MFSKVWKDPVISTVFGSLILSCITALGTYFLGYWPDIKKFLTDSCLYLVSPSNVPVWWVALSSIISVLSIVLIFFGRLLERNKTESVSWLDYKKDTFWGVEWHWSYWGGEIQNLNSLCPKCKYEMVIEHQYTSYQKITYKCEDCGYIASISGDSEYDVSHKVNLKIQQKLRTGEWVKSC
ncbi:hypothetical protein LZS85_18705 [Aliivibrio fischeri]|uniref:hypothetical protein n=1 Tax=Aliivibrio fischeri TaxID=668 RepID=UPI001F38C671|nr:hypothetical protein [Aliivibrio fischeri]MCE7568165.1 hypothetical protein [Aliivibrio fischeri]